jgi:hypothetical protein
MPGVKDGEGTKRKSKMMAIKASNQSGMVVAFR